ncbi:MAG: phosphate signaling complex protein PhoU [Methyloligellaceae bacterium]
MSTDHIVKAYDEELNHLIEIIARMGGLAETQLAGAIRSVVTRDSELAARTVEGDAKVDDLEHEVDTFVVRLLALRQPMASDLRELIAALKISSDLERIADYATNVAKRTIALVQSAPVKPAHALPRMAKLTQSMIKDVLDAYVQHDADKAIEVWERDEEVDEMYMSLFRELLTYMMEDPRQITPCAHLLFIAKNIERVGDHATNIAENVHFLVHGEPLLQSRPKGDDEAFATFGPEVTKTAKRVAKSMKKAAKKDSEKAQ